MSVNNQVGRLFEGNQDNNEASTVTNVTNSPADLIVTNVEAPDQNFSGETALIRWTVQNIGATMWDGTRYWRDEIYFSSDPVLLPGRATLLANVPFSPAAPLAPGESYSQERQIT